VGLSRTQERYTQTMRILAVIHLVWSLVLMLIAAWFAAAAFRILPYLSTGTPWTNLPGILTMAAMQAGPPIALGVWMALLGRWAWRGHPNIRAMLLVTHGVLLVPGIEAVVIGMGALGAFPLAAGICMSAVAVLSIALALVGRPWTDGDGPG